MKTIMAVKLLDNNGTEAYKRFAFKLRNKGITEDRFRKILDRKLPGWQEKEDFRIRMEEALEILFHTFF